ncbi:MAG: hypothetical protein US40_C0002G0015 [Candidatus Roizmanbacteria bacterium GW2011_GWC2_37_13]|uniref:OmpR/PhoB-type domain-containing protein n=1 Tax=Candidatus Roizmanbacteria bacterium GW2011_GWC2_37_13 TaxID=1618486 RepID=A0A0G0JE90_9BACT|nr:MAG: hypothetical protein US38_C0006G0015 [Candidatus Roizmanbacteria bacterium GW2011_GWC1_37_12]KKQ26481.1 MAG: hypothetical protein US40_C0002G0015 [Candidatus Roizmanbacteria bacterium GW2011_GWC2_37_13]
MKNQNSVTLPEDFLAKFASDIFVPLKRGECVSCMFAAGGGKRTIFNYLLSKETILKKIFKEIYKKTLFVYIDPNEILNISTEAYLHLILENLVFKMKQKKIKTVTETISKNPLVLIKKNLENLVLKEYHIIFILNDFEFTLSLPLSIYLNLESIMSIDKSRIVYLFLSTINLFDETVLRNLQNLKHAISRNVRFFSLLNQDAANYLIDRFREKTKTKITHRVKDVLFELCGGHPQLLKYSFNNLRQQGQEFLEDYRKSTSYLISHYQLNIVCADIWNFLSEKEKEAIISVVTTGNFLPSLKESVDYLINLGLIKKITDQKYQLFGILFEQFIKNKLPKHKLIFNSNNKKLYYGGQSCEDKFTYQEFKLLTYFITHENELVTRDQVAEAIWGRHYLEKYSDWSIDKSISILRKKLDALGFRSEYLTTLKKRGFSFSNPE